MSLAETINSALRLHQSGHLAEAEAVYRKVLAEHPGHADALHLLGVICYQSGQNEQSLELISRAIAVKGDMAEFYHNLGLTLVRMRRWDQAAAAFSRALNLRPHYPKALHNLAGVYREQGKPGQAIAAWKRALQLKPDYAEAHNSYGAFLWGTGDIDGALAGYRKAIVHQPVYPQAYFNLGVLLQQQEKYDEALAAFSSAAEQKPDYTEALTNIGVIHKLCGRLDEAVAYYRRAMGVQPQNTTAHSNLVYLMEFRHGVEPQESAEHQRAFAQQHAAPLEGGLRPHENDRSRDRRLRVGYISPDLRNHVVGSNLLPLLREHDHQQFEIFCYASVDKLDSMSKRLQLFTDGWRDIAQMSDSEAAETVRNDKIDILVDLTLHMADNRLLVMARKPAPVQVSYLGYCGSTGLKTIDYRISDSYMDPGDQELAYYTERTIRLPNSYWCYQRPDPAPPVAPLPALKNGYITFGCLNNFSKVSAAALDTWAEVLAVVPNSRMLIHCLPGSHREAARARFGAAGGRVEFIGKQAFWQYLLTYRRIDVALDPFPYAGGITTCDGLWMGVPIVTLAGRTAVGRGGCSILSNIGLPQWIARSTADYVRLAADLAGDIQRLTDLRSDLRPRMLMSPLMDAKQFARDVEAAYRQMWVEKC